jgi:4-amino-4-deoxy-L-arabinose transferase-like glycosyltransferase
MNLAIRLPRFRRQRLTSAFIGLLFAGMVLTKTTALFLLPALVSVFVVQFRHEGRRLIGLLIVAGAAAAFALSLWVLAVASNGLYLDFAYFFSVNDYPKPKGMWENLESLWLTCRGITQPDRIFIAVPALLVLATVVVRIRSFNMPRNWADELWRDPVFFGSIFAIGGYIAFMTYQNHPQPRYYVVIAFFSFCLLAQITSHILNPSDNTTSIVARRLGKAVLATALITIAVNGIRTLNYVMHPQYTWVTAATNLTSYIDQHPNGNRLLLATSGDEITLITHVPALCDIWGTEKLSIKLARYQPGWYATWDRLDPRILEEIHTGFAVKQVASFPAFDDPGHSVLYLFQLHPLPPSEFRNEGLPGVMPGDVISIPVI